jgi:hypothetical protein
MVTAFARERLRLVELVVCITRISGIPKDVVRQAGKATRCALSGFLIANQRAETARPKDFIQEHPYTVYVVFTDLNEDTPTICEQLARDGKSIPQIGEVAMHTQMPSITVRADHFYFARKVMVTILYIAIANQWLKVALEPDSVRRVNIYHLYLASQILASRQRRHDLKAVTQNKAIRRMALPWATPVWVWG